MRLVPLSLLSAAAACLCGAALADTPQQLSAQVGDALFASDDDGITLIAIGETFTLTAATAGASVYPPPKTRIDRLSIVCDGYAPGRSFVLTNSDFDRSSCDVRFVYGSRPFGEDPDAEYQLDKSSAKNRLEVTAASGKVIEGRFTFQLEDKAGRRLSIEEGRFKAEDRQY